MKDIRITTFSNSGRWETPVVDIACASFLYSSPFPSFSGIQYATDDDKNEQVEEICHEIAKKVFELHKLINK